MTMCIRPKRQLAIYDMLDSKKASEDLSNCLALQRQKEIKLIAPKVKVVFRKVRVKLN